MIAKELLSEETEIRSMRKNNSVKKKNSPKKQNKPKTPTKKVNKLSSLEQLFNQHSEILLKC